MFVIFDIKYFSRDAEHNLKEIKLILKNAIPGINNFKLWQ